MTTQRPTFYPDGINNYVPGMQYDAHCAKGRWTGSLGSATYDQDGIDNDADGDPAANTVVWAADMDGAFGRTSGATYGQSVVLKVSADPGAGGIDVDVYGYDYLGQVIVETLTVASGVTAETETTKAFKSVTKHVTTNPATNAITFDLGWGNRLGVPFKIGMVDGVAIGSDDMLPMGYRTSETTAAVQAGVGVTAATQTVPIDGYIVGNAYEVTTAQTTSAATLDVVVAGTGQATLDLVVPVAAIGLSGSNDLARSGWIRVAKGDTITITSDGGGDAGVVAVTFYYQSADPLIAMPDTTDPATKTTDDPRGTIQPQVTLDGTIGVSIDYRASSVINAAGNGGLHGIQHYAP